MKSQLPLLVLSIVLIASSLRAMDFPKHPFVLIDQTELSALRDDLAKPGWKRDVYLGPAGVDVVSLGKGLKTNADFWLHQKIEIPPYGGRGHNFFCDDGTYLSASPAYRYYPGPYKCPKCGKTYDAPRYQAAHALQVHHLLSQAALDMALVGAIEQKPEYTAKSAEILLKYADVYPGPHTSNVAGGLMEQSLDECVWVIRLSKAYDLVANDLTADQRAKIEKFLHTVAEGLAKTNVGGNWASWHLSAVGVIGYAIGDEELVNYALEHFKGQMQNNLGDDGVWPESLHCYHYYVLQAFTNLAEAARHAGVDLYRCEAKPGKSMLRMLTEPLPLAYPDLRLPAINDGWFESYPPAEVYETAYRQTGDPLFAWVLAAPCPKGADPWLTGTKETNSVRNTRNALLIGRDLPSDTPTPGFRSANTSTLGISALRSADNTAMMTFHYGPFVGHGHIDKMGITLWAHGKLWAADYGTQGYGSASVAWFHSACSHNMIIVDGKEPARTKERAADLWLGDPDMDGARSTTQEAYPGVTWTRTVIRVGDYFVVRDQLESPDSHTYDFYLHADGRLLLDGLKDKPLATEPMTPWIKDLKAWPAQTSLSGRWEWSSQALDIRMIGSGPITPMIGQCPAETALRTIPLLIARQTGRSAEFITVLYPHYADADIRADYSDGKLVVTHGTTEDTLVFPEVGGRPSITSRSTSP